MGMLTLKLEQVASLGGHPLFLSKDDIQLGV